MIKVPLYKDCDCSDIIERTIASAKPFETVCFESGEYYISNKISVSGKKNVRLLGQDTTFVSRFDANSGYRDYKGVFEFCDCDDLTIENFSFNTSSPSNSSGEIISVDEGTHTIDVSLYDGNVMDGSQTICAINSLDAEGTPDYLIATYGISSYRVLKDSIIRVELPKTVIMKNIPIGEQICFRHGLGGYQKLCDAALTFKNCSDVVLKDINVYSCIGYMTVIFPRCRNFTFVRYNVLPKNLSNQLLASNVDAIHIVGLAGSLNVSDCCFYGLGDDAINIHSSAAYVKKVKNDCIAIENKRFEIPMVDEWCSNGDVINVYDKNLLYKGNFNVERYENSLVYFCHCDCRISEGDFLANASFFAKVSVSDCKFKNSRARALLLQTENIRIKNCDFYGISLSAILMAPDVRKWYEVGPVKNVFIENCNFQKCAVASSSNGNAVISVKTSHDMNEVKDKTLHGNVNILDNTFVDCDNLFSVCCTDGVVIKGNRAFDNGKEYAFDENEKKIQLYNCKHCYIDN